MMIVVKKDHIMIDSGNENNRIFKVLVALEFSTHAFHHGCVLAGFSPHMENMSVKLGIDNTLTGLDDILHLPFYQVESIFFGIMSVVRHGSCHRDAQCQHVVVGCTVVACIVHDRPTATVIIYIGKVVD